MSFRTVTYDVIFERAERIENVLDNLQNKLNSLQRIIERRPQMANRLERRVNMFNNQIEQLERTYDNITAELPKDSISTSFMVDPITGLNMGVTVDVANSPYDDTYEGENLSMVLQASGRWNGRKTTLRNIIEEGQIIDGTDTVGFGSRSTGQMLNGKYETVNLLFVNDANETVFSQNIISDYAPVI